MREGGREGRKEWGGKGEDASYVSENFSRHTPLIRYLSFLPYDFCNACLDMYVRQ